MRTKAPARIAPQPPAPARRAWRPALALLAAALLVELVLAWLTALMWMPRFFTPAAGISLDFVKMLGPDWVRNTTLQYEAFTALFLAFFVALWILRRRPPSRRALALVFLPPVIWSLTTMLLYPPYAVDLFHNLADGRLLWLYHLNPMTVAPDARRFPIRMSFDNQPSAYGPVWYLLDFPPSLLQPGSFLGGILTLKLWMDCFYLASGALIYAIVRREWRDLALFAAALYLWNPFVVVRTLGDGHNDVVMFFFVLLALYSVATEKWIAVLPALMLSALVKYVSLILGPIVLVYVLMLPRPQRGPAALRLFAGGGIALALAVAAFLPFWAGPHTFDALRAEGDKSITSTPLLVEAFLADRLYGINGAAVARLWMRILFLLPYGLLLMRVRPPVRRLNAAAYLALLAYVLIAAAWFRPWYFLWPITIGALLPSGWFLALTLTLSWFGMFPDIVEQYRGFVPWLAAEPTRVLLAPIVVAFLPPLLVWIAGVVRTHSWCFAVDEAGPIPRPLPHGGRGAT